MSQELMDPERWQRINAVLAGALDRDPGTRAGFIQEACAGDEELRRDIETLLESHLAAMSFIESPAIELAAPILADDDGTFEVGASIGPYGVKSQIGAGGMGEVYLAWDAKLGRNVALKLLPGEFGNYAPRVHRFQQEARAASGLNHPNIITIHDIGQVDGRHYIAMEHVEGETLRQHLTGGNMQVQESIDIAVQVASALAAAHQAGIVHRDVKPENIMVRPDGYVKVLDFGLAKLIGSHPIDPGGASQPTATVGDASSRRSTLEPGSDPGTLMGTAQYMSPEQAQARAADHRTDIFSFGVLLYEMLTGQQPFARNSRAETLDAITRFDPVSPTQFNTLIPSELDQIVVKCLQKDSDLRYSTAEELLVDLKRVKRNLESAATRAEGGIDEQRTSRRRVLRAAVIVGLLVGVGAGLKTFFSGEAPIESLAILPLVNESSDPDTQYLSDGITERLINGLSQLPRLRVIPRDSVFELTGQGGDARSAVKKLGVQAVLTGRIAQRGDELVISLELVDARNNRQLWGERYNGKLSALLTSQADISADILEKLRLSLSSEEAKQVAKLYTQNSEAYRLYLQGRYIFNNAALTGGRRAKSIEYYEKAIQIDPNFALAYSGLADAHLFQNLSNRVPPSEAMPKAKAAALKALDLDDRLAEAHTSLGNILMVWDWDFPGAERELKRALELNPNNPWAHRTYAIYLGYVLGRPEEAVERMRKAVELDPISLGMNNGLGVLLYLFTRRYDEAIEQFQKTLEFYPNRDGAHHEMGKAYALKGAYEQALAEFKKSKSGEVPGWVYALMGREAEARKAIAKLEEDSRHGYSSPLNIAAIYACLGDRDRAFKWLEKVYEERGRLLQALNLDQRFDKVRDDPRFADLRRRMGLKRVNRDEGR
ncbi:MAG: protein kinase [Acidobacteria bacterium]|nr:protein kinase [Acidobacteriota bacterium]